MKCAVIENNKEKLLLHITTIITDKAQSYLTNELNYNNYNNIKMRGVKRWEESERTTYNSSDEIIGENAQ